MSRHKVGDLLISKVADLALIIIEVTHSHYKVLHIHDNQAVITDCDFHWLSGEGFNKTEIFKDVIIKRLSSGKELGY